MARKTGSHRTLYKMVDNQVVKIPLGNSYAPRTEDDVSRYTFKERMTRTLYQMECEQGARFRVPEYSTDTLKGVWK